MRIKHHNPESYIVLQKHLCLALTRLSVSAVAMVIKTRSPSVRAALGSGQKLHCRFSADHKGPNVTAEWHRRRRGEVTRLFSHAARSGVAEGSGVALRALASGDASYDLPFAEVKSEATYICSVSVPPLLGALEIDLRIEGKGGGRSAALTASTPRGSYVY